MIASHTPIGKMGWEVWSEKELKFLKESYSADMEHEVFRQFCDELKSLVDQFLEDLAKIESARKKQDRQKEIGDTAKSLGVALRKARRKGLFKGKAPDFFIHLLIRCCENEQSTVYKKGDHLTAKSKADFIASVANLLFKYTKKSFVYGSKADPLCMVVSESMEGVGCHGHSRSAVRDAIKRYIAVEGCCVDSGLPAYRRYGYDDLAVGGMDDLSSCPDGFSFEKAVPVLKQKIEKSKVRPEYRYSHVIGDFTLLDLPANPEALVAPNLSIWMRRMMVKALQEQDRRSKIIIHWWNTLGLSEVPGRISRDDDICEQAVKLFRDHGEIYSPDDMLDIIQASLRLVVKSDSDQSEVSQIQYMLSADHPGNLELPCDADKVVRVETALLDPIPE